MSLPVLAYLFITFLVAAWITDMLPFIRTARNISSLSQDSVRTMQSQTLVDDDKQKILLRNSLAIFKHSLKIFFFTILLGVFLFLCLKASDLIKPHTYSHLSGYLLTWQGVGLALLAFMSFFTVKGLYAKFRV